MKFKPLFSLLLLGTILSCSKDNDTSTPSTTTGDLTMKVDGIAWSGTFITNMVDDATEQVLVNALNAAKNETFGFTFDYFSGAGTYPTANDNIGGALYLRTDKVLFTGDGAAIKYIVSSIETKAGVKKIHGSFSGKVKDKQGTSLTITEGKF